MSQLRIAFAGELFSGKDTVATRLGAARIGFADPIYAVSRYFNGTDDKSVPGIRRFMQLVGQWGWGFVSEDPDYQHSPARALLAQQIRTLGMSGEFGSKFHTYRWADFGKSKTLWVDMLQHRMEQMIDERVAITNVRFDHEVEFCEQQCIPLFLVDCSQEARYARLEKAGGKLGLSELMDTSEMLPARLRETLPDDRIIWNDLPERMPAGKRYVLAEHPEQIISLAKTQTAVLEVQRMAA